MFGDYKETESKIKHLIENGVIKDEHDFDDVPIDLIPEKYGLCLKELLCYRCYKSNNFVCEHGCK